MLTVQAKMVVRQSYCNEGQNCHKCKIYVYPYKQWPLLREFRLFE